MLIGLNGRLKSGKDTTYLMIRDRVPEAIRVSFADALKNSAAESIGMSRELLEWLKNQENFYFKVELPRDVHERTVIEQLDYELQEELEQWKMTGRQYLQWYGTEGHRSHFGEDFWVDAALPAGMDHSNEFIVVTDMRFPNEVQRVRDLGGVTVKVERNVGTAFHDHASEQDIDHLIDYFLPNQGTLSDLEAEVEILLAELPRLEGHAISRRIHTHAQQLLEAH